MIILWENETKLDADEAVDAVKSKETIKTNTFPVPVHDGDNIMLVQAIICVAILIFIIITRTVAMPLFDEIKNQYKLIMNTGVDISEQGELVRFINNVVDNVRMQASEIMNKLETVQTTDAIGGKITEGYAVSSGRYFISQPLNAPANGEISSKFGLRKNPFQEETEFHAGLDIAAPKNAHVMSALKGTVTKTGQDKIRGNYIIVQHANNLQTIYQHLNKIYVKENSSVLRGQIIASVGDTGLTTGAHLHFEILVDNISVNPDYALR